jgi:hypothetical protein
MERPLFREDPGDGADERDLEPVQDPGDPEGRDHEPVPAAPGEPVESSRDFGGDRPAGAARNTDRLAALALTSYLPRPMNRSISLGKNEGAGARVTGVCRKFRYTPPTRGAP